MPSHKAIVHKGKDQAGVIEDRETPNPGPDGALIQLTATAINPVDWKIVAGEFPVPFPVILGYDGAGIIEAVGDEVKDFKAGERVFFQGILGKEAHATFQQKAILDTKLLAKTPDNISDAEGSGVMLAAIAAVVGLYSRQAEFHITPGPWDKGGDQAGKGKAIVILGGSSSVGQYALQLARLSGFSKILTTASSKHASRLKGFGASEVLDRSTSPGDFVKAAGDLPIYGVYDAIGDDETTKTGIEVLQIAHKSDGEKSHLVTVIPTTPNKDYNDPPITQRNFLGTSSNPEIQDVCLPFIRAISGNDGWIGKGEFVPNVMQKVDGGLKGLDEALALNRKGLSGVKVWIDPRE